MGIVSFCPNGHRVKVKDHLAGRKGICPRCGSRFRIPAANPLAKPLHATAAPAAAPLMPSARIVSFDAVMAAGLPPALPLSADPPASHPPAPLEAVEVVAAVDVEAAVEDPAAEPATQAAAEADAVPHAESQPIAAVPAPASAAAEIPWPVPEPGDVPAAEVEVLADRGFSSYAAIDEDPQLPWFVAIDGAGRWLSADALRQWLDSGQASGEEQVCRADWKGAKGVYEVFPEIDPGAGW